MAELKIAQAGAFAPQVETVQLPSQAGTDEGVVLRKPQMVELFDEDGNAPDALSQLVVKHLSQSNGKEAKQVEIDITAENLPGLMRTMQQVAVKAFVTPRCVMRDAYDALAEADREGVIAANWLNMDDLAFVFGFVLGQEYQQAESFRQE